jgi:nickel-dependent lactate racemase
VVIAVTDATRACPDHILLPPMLEALHGAGISPEAITILVAIGTHRPSTDAEKRAKLGEDIVDRYEVIDHDPYDQNELRDVWRHDSGVVFRVNRRAIEADVLIATGIVEPHQYAGYSGGGKTIAIGCANEAVIEYTHGPAFLDHAGTRLATIVGNPFQDAVREVARRAGLDFVANVVKNTDGGIVDIRYGAPEPVHDELARLAGSFMTSSIPHQMDIAIAGVPAPKDANLYQVSRAASYLQFAPTPVVKPGGVIIIPARCEEGVGAGPGEQRFAKAMRDPGGPAAIIADAREHGIKAGAQRAYVMAQVLQDIDVIIAGAEHPEALSDLGFGFAPSVETALNRVAYATNGEEKGKHSLLLVPHALQTLPIVNPPA